MGQPFSRSYTLTPEDSLTGIFVYRRAAFALSGNGNPSEKSEIDDRVVVLLTVVTLNWASVRPDAPIDPFSSPAFQRILAEAGPEVPIRKYLGGRIEARAPYELKLEFQQACRIQRLDRRQWRVATDCHYLEGIANRSRFNFTRGGLRSYVLIVSQAPNG